MTKGWLKIQEPEDLQTALTRMLNKILACDDPLAHAGRFATLANSWINCKRLQYEAGDWAEIRERLDLIEKAQAIEAQDRHQSAQEFNENLEQLKILVKELE